MAEEKLGVENLSKVLVTTVHLFNKIDEVTQDGYQVLADSIALLPNLVDVVGVVKNGKMAYAEFLDLDDEEKVEVLAIVQKEFDLNDDVLEVIIEKALLWLENGVDLGLEIRDALKKE